MPPLKSQLGSPRILLLGLSFISTVLCAFAAAAHYRKSPWGSVWQPIGWLLSMAFLVSAFWPSARELAAGLRASIRPRTAFFLFWLLFFVVSHLWNFRTAPWNGNSLFDESANDLGYLKSNIIGHPYQAAWFHGIISRETLFHYYVWGFLKLFGFNIMSYEAALFVIWLTAFLFTLLLVHLFFGSYIVTSVTALVFNFLPFAFIYTFVGYRYPMTVALAVVSLYFLHKGFRSHRADGRDLDSPGTRPQRASHDSASPADTPYRPPNCISEAAYSSSEFCLVLGGIAAGLCLASSIPGKQYLLALVIAAPIYAVFYSKSLTQTRTWGSIALLVYGFLTAATPILSYIIFNWEHYTSYEGTYVHQFWNAVRGTPSPNNLQYYVTGLWNCFFAVDYWPRLLFPDALPIPLPYYWLLLPGLVLALWGRRFEVALLATLPVVGVFVSGGPAVEQRLLLAIPFWIVLISFPVAGMLKLRRWPGVRVVVGAVAALVLLDGLVPSIRYIYSKAHSPFAIHHYAQHQVAVSRFLKHVVAGQEHPGPPRLERDEFNRIEGIPDPRYDTFICQNDAYSIIHLFLHDYDDAKILSFCSGLPFFWVMTEQDVWRSNKNAILSYTPADKDLKLIWERAPKTERIIAKFESLRDLGAEDSLSFSFGGMMRRFYVLNIPNKNIREVQERVAAFPATPDLNVRAMGPPTMFEGGKGTGKGEFESPTAITIADNGNVFIADTGNGRIQKFSPTGGFLTTIKIAGNDRGQLSAPSGIAVDHAGSIYVSDVAKQCVEKLGQDGMIAAEWKGPDPGFYGPRRIAIGRDDSIYVVDQGRTRIVKFNPAGGVLSVWGGKGSNDGQFDDPTSVAVDLKTEKVYVADPRNKRIQVFDSNGKFLAKWVVPEWGKSQGFEDLAIDSDSGRLYASSANTNVLLVFDFNGTRTGSLAAKPPATLDAPSGLALRDRKLYVLNMATNRVSVIEL